MSSNPLKKAPSIRRRILEVKESWSPDVRQSRAQEGRRRRQELFSMVAQAEPEIWAVGAPVVEDCERIADAQL